MSLRTSCRKTLLSLPPVRGPHLQLDSIRPQVGRLRSRFATPSLLPNNRGMSVPWLRRLKEASAGPPVLPPQIGPHLCSHIEHKRKPDPPISSDEIVRALKVLRCNEKLLVKSCLSSSSLPFSTSTAPSPPTPIAPTPPEAHFQQLYSHAHNPAAQKYIQSRSTRCHATSMPTVIAHPLHTKP